MPVDKQRWKAGVSDRGLALYKTPAAFEKIRGVVRHLAAFFKQVAAFVDRLAAHIGEGFFSVLGLLADITPGIPAGLRSVEQCDRGAERRPR